MKPRILPIVAVIFSQISLVQGQTINDPVAYYNFETDFINQASNGYSHNGTTLTGTPTISAGIVGNALTLNGSSSVQLPGMGSSYLGNSFSISAWYYQNNSTTRMMIFEASDNFDVSYGANGANSNFTSYVNQTVGPVVTTPTGAWNHIVHTFSFNGTNTILTVYINGVAQTVTPAAGAVGALSFTSLNLGTYRTANDRFLNGKIDEVALWKRTLSAADVAVLYNSGIPLAVPTTQILNSSWSDADPATAGITGGSFNWSDPIWKSGPGEVSGAVWTPGNIARFDPIVEGPTSSTITISGNESALSAVFSGSNHSITGGTLTLNNPGSTITAEADGNIASVLAGTSGYAKNGPAKLTLSGTNTLTGNTRILGGTLQLDGGNAVVDTTSVILENTAGAGLILGANETVGSITGGGGIGGDINLQGFTLTTGGSNAAATLGGIVSGTGGSIVKNGTGALTLSGVNTYTGGTSLNTGRINAATNSALGTGAINVGTAPSFGAAYVSGGAPFLAMTSTAAATLANDIILPAPVSTAYYALQKFTASASTGTNLELSGVISGGGANMILQLDSPTGGDSTTSFTLSGTNTFAGQVRLNRGCVLLTNAASLGTASLFVQSNGNTTDGNIRFTNPLTLSNNIIFGTTNGNTINTGVNDITLSGVVSGPANWSKINGSGTLTLSAVNTGTGSINVDAGTLKVTGNIFADAYNDKVITLANGSVLDLQNWGYDQNITHSTSLGGLTANASALVLNGGTIRISGTTPTSYVRGFTVNSTGATLEAAAGADWTLASGTAPIYNGNPQLTLTGAGTGRFEKAFTGTGSLIKSGAGTWTLAGTNTHTGNTFVDEGTLRLESPSGRLTFAVNGTSSNFVDDDGGNDSNAVFDAEFFLDLSSADLTDGNVWTLVEMEAVSYEDDFVVNSALGEFDRNDILHTLSEGNNTWTFNEDEGTLSLSITPALGYEGWIGGFFPDDVANPAIVGANADPDNDGIDNAVEFVLGGDPKEGMDVGLMPTLSLVSDPGGSVPDGDYLLFTFSRAAASLSAGVQAIAEYDTNLTGTWTRAEDGVAGVEVVETPNGIEAGIDKVEVFIPRGSNTTIFGRLSAVVP